MARVRLTKQFSFEMAHALNGYDGACSQLHGHSYQLFVTVSGEPLEDPSSPKYGMALDFGVLKRTVTDRIISRLDHALLIRADESNAAMVEELRRTYSSVRVVDWQPTCENMVIHFAELLAEGLPDGIELVSVRLCETATSYAEWFASDNR